MYIYFPLLVLVVFCQHGEAFVSVAPTILATAPRGPAELDRGSTPLVSSMRGRPAQRRGPSTFLAAVPSTGLGGARLSPVTRVSSRVGRLLRRLKRHALKLSFVCVLAVSAFFANATPAVASQSPTLSAYDPAAPALEVPGAERYLKKFMWSPDKYNLFESIYLEAEKPISEALAPGSKIPVSSAMLAKVVTEVGPTLAVGGLVLGGGVGAVKLDGYIKGLKEREREEEIELYGEELTVDATPVEMPDVELPPDEDDEDDS